jgi:hypothetical protein
VRLTVEGCLALEANGRGWWAGERHELTWTPCHFGGRRWWLVCPRCGRRGLRLYRLQGAPQCRRCAGLSYQSQRLRPLWRALEQAERARIRLGGGGSLFGPFPPKPPRMHSWTYRRLAARCASAERRFGELMERWVGRTDRWLERHKALQPPPKSPRVQRAGARRGTMNT